MRTVSGWWEWLFAPPTEWIRPILLTAFITTILFIVRRLLIWLWLHLHAFLLRATEDIREDMVMVAARWNWSGDQKPPFRRLRTWKQRVRLWIFQQLFPREKIALQREVDAARFEWWKSEPEEVRASERDQERTDAYYEKVKSGAYGSRDEAIADGKELARESQARNKKRNAHRMMEAEVRKKAFAPTPESNPEKGRES